MTLQKIVTSIKKFSERNAFFIQGKFYTYSQFAKKISAIRKLLQKNKINQQNVGLYSTDSIESYASILALWLERCSYVPINPKNPLARNNSIIEQANIASILTNTSREDIQINVNLEKLCCIETCGIEDENPDLSFYDSQDSDIKYILFTSGSTGIPKGVPINSLNLNAFIEAFFEIGYPINENDRFLQIFDFSFDVSVQCYVLPLCKGACIYTVPQTDIKYLTAYQILEEHKVTFAKMVPSTLAYLRPYFEDINLPELKYSLFSGEAMNDDITREWAKCVPNALIQNHYGPTEATIDCLFYDWKVGEKNKVYNGVISIGKPFNGMKAIVIDEKFNELPQGEKGELCIAGAQVTLGYWNNPEKNNQAFFKKIINSEEITFYRTGDLVFKDLEGDYMYCGRIDYQVQIQGFRVELAEIEENVRRFTNLAGVVAIAQENKIGNMEILLFVEKYEGEINSILEHLKTKLPWYMIPSICYTIPTFPTTTSGKIDRKKLLQLKYNEYR